jgi:hypothetical protein
MYWLAVVINFIAMGASLCFERFLCPRRRNDALLSVAREPELQEWIDYPKPEQKKQQPLTQEILSAIDRFYFNHYCETFRSGAFARANSSMYVCLDTCPAMQIS